MRRVHRLVFVLWVMFVCLAAAPSRAEEAGEPPDPARAPSPGAPTTAGAASPGGAPPGASPEQVLARFAHEPTIAQIHAWTLRHARLDARTIEGLWRASRTFAALPQLTVEYRLKDGWDQDFRYVDERGAALESVDQPAFALLDDGGADQDAQYTIRARWELSDLIFSSERVRVLAETQDAVKLRDQLLAEATRLYFDRRRIQAEMLLAPRPDLHGRVRDEVELLELTARLDALTGGAFGRALARPP